MGPALAMVLAIASSASKIATGTSLRGGNEGVCNTLFGHLSAISARTGEDVGAGQVIGRAGSTGRSTGPHLHYEVRRDGRPVDPRSYL